MKSLLPGVQVFGFIVAFAMVSGCAAPGDKIVDQVVITLEPLAGVFMAATHYYAERGKFPESPEVLADHTRHHEYIPEFDPNEFKQILFNQDGDGSLIITFSLTGSQSVSSGTLRLKPPDTELFEALDGVYIERPIRDDDLALRIRPGTIIGYRVFIGTNEIQHVHAEYDGGEYIDFSNGIGIRARNQTVWEIIREMEEAVNYWELPWSAIHESDGILRARGQDANSMLNYLRMREREREDIEFRRHWYIGER